jgi:hypothetical protein
MYNTRRDWQYRANRPRQMWRTFTVVISRYLRRTSYPSQMKGEGQSKRTENPK